MKRYIKIITGALVMFSLLITSQIPAATSTSSVKAAGGISFNWKADNSYLSYDYNCIVFGKGLFVVAGEKGIISVSSDLKKWNNIMPAAKTDYEFLEAGYQTILFNGEMFVAAGERTISYSRDGYHWNDVMIDYEGMLSSNLKLSEDAVISSGATNGKTFVLSGRGALLHSEDGINWTQQYGITVGHSAGGGDGYFFSNVLYDSSKFITVCNFTDPVTYNNKFYVYTSEDGDLWNITEFRDTNRRLYEMLNYIGGKFLISAYDFNLHKYVTMETDDLRIWSQSDIYQDYMVFVVNGTSYKLDNGVYKLISLHSNKTLYTTTDKDKLKGICSGNGKIVAVGTNGLIIYQDILDKDDTNWTKLKNMCLRDIYSAAHDNNTLIAVGKDGQVLKSPDGENWSVVKTEINKTLHSVIYDGEYFVAVGDEGTVAISRNGSLWSLLPQKTKMNLLDIKKLNGIYLVSGNGIILSSKDVNSLKKVYGSEPENNNYDPFCGTAFKDGVYYALAKQNSIIYTSKDAVSWTKTSRLKGWGYSDFTYYRNRFVLIGNNMSVSKDMKTDSIIKQGFFSGSSSIGMKISVFRDFLLTGTPQGDILYSTDGLEWLDAGNKHTPDKINAILEFKGRYFGFSDNGVIHKGTLISSSSLPSEITVSSFYSNNYTGNMAESFEKPNNPPIFRNDTMLLSVDSICRFIRSEKNYDKKKKALTINIGKKTIVFIESSPYAMVNGNKTKLPKKLEIIGNVIYVPAKFTLNSLGFSFSYDSFKRRIVIAADDKPKNNLVSANQLTPERNNNNQPFVSISYNKNIYAAVTRNGKIFTSKDLVNFSETAAFKDVEFSKILWNGKRFIAAGGTSFSAGNTQEGLIYVSEDGITFRKLENISLGKYICDGVVGACGNALNDAYSGNDIKQTVLTNVEGIILVSEDGLTWKKYYEPNINHSYSVCWMKGTYYLTSGNNNYIRYSSDGKSWSSYNAGIKVDSLASSGGTLWAISNYFNNLDSSALYKSTNGKAWSYITELPFKSIIKIIYKDIKYVLFGYRYGYVPSNISGSFTMTSSNGDLWEYSNDLKGINYFYDIVNFDKQTVLSTNKGIYSLSVKQK